MYTRTTQSGKNSSFFCQVTVHHAINGDNYLVITSWNPLVRNSKVTTSYYFNYMEEAEACSSY
jgi:hypothetical protein